MKVLKQDRRANDGREGTTHVHRSPEPATVDDRTGGMQLDESSSLIDDIVREGARRMLAEALQAGVEERITRFAEERDEAGRRLVVVRNGYHEPPRGAHQRRRDAGARAADQ